MNTAVCPLLYDHFGLHCVAYFAHRLVCIHALASASTLLALGATLAFMILLALVFDDLPGAVLFTISKQHCSVWLSSEAASF